MRIKQGFPKIVLVLGLASILLVSMPSPGQCNRCNDEVIRYQQSGWDVKSDFNSNTGECNLSASRTDPKTGEVKVVKKDTNEKTGDFKMGESTTFPDGHTNTRTSEGNTGIANDELSGKRPIETKTSERDTYPDGRSTETTWNPSNGHKTSETKTEPNGARSETTYDPSDGHKTSQTNSFPDGSEHKYTYAANGGTTSYNGKGADGSTLSISFDPNSCPGGTGGCNRISQTEKSADGSVTKTRYGPNDKPTSKSRTDGKTGQTTKYTCLDTGQCYDSFKAAPRGGFEGAVKKPPFVMKPKTDVTGAKQKIKDEVLGQIEAKPRGGLTTRKEKAETGVIDRSKVSPVKASPFLAKPKARDLSVGRKEGPLKARVQTGVMDRSKDSPVKASPFQARPKARDLSVGQKEGPLRAKSKPLDVTATQKQKSNVTSRSQSVGSLQSRRVGAAERKVQSQAAQPLRTMPKDQDWGAKAGQGVSQKYRQLQ